MTPTRDEELAALRRPFLIGVACVVLAVVALGVVIGLFGSGADRPAGIAERWLVAVGDTTREGIEADARDRIEELSADGEVDPGIDALLALAPTAAEDGRAAFESVQVGRPLRQGDVDEDATSIPAIVTPYEGDPVEVYVVLARDDGWEVRFGALVADVDCGGECPGFPIERPERAPIGWFAGALALGVLISLGCMAAVRAATPAGAGGENTPFGS